MIDSVNTVRYSSIVYAVKFLSYKSFENEQTTSFI